jgi:23S rRNA U2552 (ribose-2'-O)-methylase RlmE/FtsJ
MEVVIKPSYVKQNIKVSEFHGHSTDIKIFKRLMGELNEAKSLLDVYDGNKVYFQFSRKIFPYNGLKYLLEKRYGIKPITNAWLKTYELLCNIKDLLPKEGEYRVFFNANAPGASTLAAQYFFEQHTKLDFDWVASSYMGGETTLDDTYDLIKNNRKKWLMNKKNNGDVRIVANVEDFAKRVGKIDLYFSDIGVNIGNNYANEELIEIHEVFGQNVIGLCTLAVGGIMIVKQRSFLLPFNVWMISYMSNLFDKFEIHKPLTSRSYNSEVYLIGIGFHGLSLEQNGFLKELLHNFSQEKAHKLMTNIDKRSISYIAKIATTLVHRQKEAITTCVNLYQRHYNKLKEFHDSINTDLSITRMDFIRKHHIVSLR